MKHFFRIAAAVPKLKVGDTAWNCAEILALYREAQARGAAVAVFPELAVTGCSCGDLFLQDCLLDAAEKGLAGLAAETGETVMAVGVPLRRNGRIFNVAAILQNGRICGVTGKTLPGADGRFFSSWEDDPCCFAAGALRFCVEIGEDAESLTSSAGASVAQEGAHLILHLSSSPALAGRTVYHRNFVQVQSSRLCCACVSCGAGVHESTADGVHSGYALAGIHGEIVAENRCFCRESSIIYADINVRFLEYMRRRKPAFRQNRRRESVSVTEIAPVPASPDLAFFAVSRLPFIPEDPAARHDWCAEIAEIQIAALAKRTEHTSMKWVVGLSGGLDSALALLTAAACRDRLQLSSDAVLAVGMPGFGTTSRTKGNAEKLSELLGVPYRTIPIGDAVSAHFSDIGHDPENRNAVYENAQARERTQVLMDLANEVGALVLGTGDLSEIALGWSTFNGDHMSMYGINCSVPKTLIRHIVAYYKEVFPQAAEVLEDILQTPVSPELLPGKQYTEELLGSYELHDFFLYYFVKSGASPDELLALGAKAFPEMDAAARRAGLEKFLKRFFSQQFKRNASPDGPDTGAVSLSARGGWVMPSDASPAEWLKL